MEGEGKIQSLLEVMSKEGLLPSPEEALKRRYVVDQLQQIVILWAKKVAWQRRMAKNLIAGTSAMILTYGSYGLGAHGSFSDIDALCVGPAFATREDDFFIVLRNMLQSRSEVSEIACVTTAKVPLICFKFNGVLVDLAYLQLPFILFTDNMNIFEPYTLANMDKASLKSFSGVCFKESILKQIPNLENFQSVLRCIKLWAKRRGIYSSLHGFLGGVHFAILVAFVCCDNPDASISVLISRLFETFGTWAWPTPVSLFAVPESQVSENSLGLMPILMPFYPYEVCRSYITWHTFMKIRTELQRAFRLVQAGIKTEADWVNLFDPFHYAIKYHRFLKIFLYASDEVVLKDWVGYVKSRFHLLIQKLEKVQGLCDPNPTEYFDASLPVPNKLFYWGLSPSRSSFNDIYSVEVDFMKHIRESGLDDYQDHGGSLKLTIVRAAEYAKNAQVDSKRMLEYIGLRPTREACFLSAFAILLHWLRRHGAGKCEDAVGFRG